MSRQETNNTFSEGLIKDLNPINTPNTALTDCVNGTIITYDGNEYSLQNDKGNYGLKHCKLSPNYIPVGIKEYGDILYIVSYNPLNEYVEIGSYPSPETIPDPEIIPDPKKSGPLSSEDMIIDIYSDLKKQYEIDQSNKEFSYQEIVEKYSKLYVFYGKDPDALKMHEGDEIQLTVEDELKNPFEKLQYVLVNDNRQITDISDKVSDFIGKDYKPIAWGPGWFGFKPVIAEISDNVINIKKIKVPPYDKGNANLVFNVRISTSDSLFINSNELTTSRLKAKVVLIGKDKNNNDKPINTIILPLDRFLDLKNGDYYYYSKEETQSIDIEKYSSITLEATPILYLDDNIYITYDHLKRSSIFNLSTKGNPEDFLLGELYWNWKTDSANNSISLTFDTSGLSQASILDEDVSLKYSIFGLNGEFIVDSNGNPYTDIVCKEWYISGDTTIEFKTTPFTKENYENNPNKLYTENIYKIEFKIVDELGELIKKFDPKIIIATELLNSSTASRYDTVPIDEWLNNYVDSIKNATFNIDANKVSDWNIGISYPDIYNVWLKPSKTFKAGNITYSTFLSDSDIKDISTNDAITWTAKCDLSIECKSDIQLLVGPMWLYFNDNCEVQFNEKTVKFDKFTGRLKESGSINAEGISTKIIPCNLIPISQDNDIWSYEEGNPTYKNLKLSIWGWCDREGMGTSNQRKDLELKFQLKSGLNSLLFKTWNLSWWGGDHTNDYTTDTSVISNSILDALKNDDLGLVDIEVGAINKQDDFCKIGITKITDVENKDIINNNKNIVHVLFLVIKLNNDVLFVEIPDTYWEYGEDSKEFKGVETVLNFCSELNRIKTIDNFSTRGGFWKMELGNATIENSSSVSINSKLLFPNELIVDKFNLLDKSTILNGLSISSDSFLFEPIILKPNKELININADFSSTTDAEANLRESVNIHNNLVEEELGNYKVNSKYSSGFNPGILYESAGTSFKNRGVLIHYMNEKIHKPDTILYGWDYYTEYNNRGTIKRRIGKISEETLS